MLELNVCRKVRHFQYHIMLNVDAPCQSLHVLQSRVLAGVRCVDAQTLQAYSLVCPGKVPREQLHLAHMMGALWLLGLQRADWLRLLFFPSSLVTIRKRYFRGVNRSQDGRPSKHSQAFLSLHAPFWFTFICHWGTIKEKTNVRFELLYVKMFSKHNSVVSCNAPLFYLLERRVWFFFRLPFLPLFLSYYHACIISCQLSVHLSLCF